MNSLRAWILLLALVSALAGFAAGRASAPKTSVVPSGPFPGYAEQMQVAFDLAPERVRALRLLLERYDRDLEDLKIRNLGELQPELVRLGDTYRDWIRDKVLPEERRADFDRMVAGGAISLID
ncbi:MAG: hypothetical protein H8D72_02435 [Planctomycetes bacterium]|nr:hypothetical protein [Planctomycetota bacterium]